MGLADINVDGGLIKGAFEGLGGFLKDIRTAITGVDPDVKAKIEETLSNAEAALNSGQAEINKVEAASSILFVAGWRPYIGWICGTALGVYYIPQALMATVLWTIQCILVMRAAVDITTVEIGRAHV